MVRLRHFSFFVSLTLLLSLSSLFSTEKELIITITDLEKELLPYLEADVLYVYLGKELSNIAHVLKEISLLDKNNNSPLVLLKKHIEDGLLLSHHEEVSDALEYAEQTLQDHYKQLDYLKAEELFFELIDVINKFMNGSLTVSMSTVKQYVENIKRSYTNIAEVKGLLSVNDQLVQNITAVNLSATDVIIGGTTSMSAFTTAGVVHNNASGLLSSSLIVNADVDPAAAIVDTKLNTISTAGKVANSATTATNANTASAIVARDASGNFATNMITLNGTTTNATDAATKAYVDAQIGATGTSLNTPNTLVLRDSTGSFAAQIVSVVDTVASGNLAFSTNPSTATTGNILKGGNSFIHNYGSANTFVGINAGNFTMTGGNNSGFGANTLAANTTGSNNIAVGTNALLANTTGQNNVAVGYQALTANTIATSNVAVGVQALFSNTTGSQNTAIGFQALRQNTTAINNVAVGYHALYANTIGTDNVAMGSGALDSNTTGYNNVAIGSSALAANTTGVYNVAIGYNTLSTSSTARFNTGVGYSSLSSTTSGENNAALGYNSLASNTTGGNNTGIGAEAFLLCTTGTYNIGVGFNAGYGLQTGTNNIYLANGYVGNGITAAESNTIRIGGTQTTCYIKGISGVTTGGAAVGVVVDGNGQLGTVSSTRRIKHAIEDMNDESANILKLRPVTFVYNSDATETKQYGLIAEEVDEMFPGIVVKDADGQVETVQYHILPVLLLNEMKKQQAELLNHKALIAQLEQQALTFVKRLEALETHQ